MKDIKILFGREGNLEHYTLLIGEEYYSFTYDARGGNRRTIIDTIAENLVQIYLLRKTDTTKISSLNGCRMMNKSLQKAGKLEDTKVSEFTGIVLRLLQGRGEVILPVTQSRN